MDLTVQKQGRDESTKEEYPKPVASGVGSVFLSFFSTIVP